MRTLKGLGVTRDSSNPTDYPYDRIKNKITGVQNGTQIKEETIGDLLQGAIELLRRAGITPSETPEKKGDSDIADAVGFLKPVAIIKVGYDGANVTVLGGSYMAGYTAEYTTSMTFDFGAAINKLTIKKGGVVSTENYYVDVTTTNLVNAKGQVTAGASHGTVNTFGYFDNDSSNIHISAIGGSYSEADLQKINLIVKIFKA